MSAFSFEARFDNAQALVAANQVVASLEGIEKKAAAMGQAIEKGAGGPQLKNAQGQYVSTAVAAEQMKTHVADLVDQWQREDDVLERIKGPARDYEANLKALNSLHQQGSIDAKEYEGYLEKLKEKMGEGSGGVKIEGGLGQAFAAQAGEVGSALEGLASKGAIEAVALAAIAKEVVNLGDEYLELTNKAQRLALGDEDINKVITEQLSLSKDLHGSLDQTIELSTVVKERTEKMGLTWREQTALTKELGQAVQLSGHSLQDATGVMERLGFALESGLPAGRELKQVMREFPEVAKAMEDGLGKTTSEIVRMGNEGKLTMDDLVSAFANAGDELGEKFAKRTETVGQQWQHFKDTLVVTIGKFVESTGIIHAIGEALSVLSTIVSAIVKPFAMLHDGLAALEDKSKILGTVIKDLALGPLTLIGKPFGILGDVLGGLTEKWEPFVLKTHTAADALKAFMDAANGVKPPLDTLHGQLQKMVDDLDKLIKETAEAGHSFRDLMTGGTLELTTGFRDLNDALGQLGITMDKWGTVTKGGAGLAMEHAAKVGEARKELKALNEELKFGVLSGEEYRNKSRELETTIEGGLSAIRKEYYGVTDAIRVYGEGTDALNRLWTQGKINALEYRIELEKLIKSAPEYALGASQATQAAFASFKSKPGGGRYDSGLDTSLNFGGNDFTPVVKTAQDTATDEVLKKYQELVPAIQKYRLEQQSIIDLTRAANSPDSIRVELLKDLKVKYFDLIDPIEKLKKKVDEYNDALSHNDITTDEHNKLMAKLKEEFVDVLPEEKYAKKLAELDAAAKMLNLSQDELARGHLKLKQEFGQPLTIGEGMSAGLAEIQKQVLDVGSTVKTSLVGAFNKANEALVQMITTGKADFASFASFLEQQIIAIALQAAEAKIFTGLFGNSALGAASQVVSGGAHASGGDYTVPGAGGPDSQNVMFKLTPGEQVHFTPPGVQPQAAESGGGGGGVPQVHFHQHYDRRELLGAMNTYDGKVEIHKTLRTYQGGRRSPLQH
jgi:tape measure domain-containing protein